jgi:hypothetical protein
MARFLIVPPKQIFFEALLLDRCPAIVLKATLEAYSVASERAYPVIRVGKSSAFFSSGVLGPPHTRTLCSAKMTTIC